MKTPIDSEPRARRAPVGALTALLLAGLLLWSACATTPATGIRGNYRKSQLQSTALLPFFATSRFGLSDEQFDRRFDWAEQTAVEWLQERGVDVTPPDETRSFLQAQSRWRHFAADGIFRSALDLSFESAPRRESRQTQTDLLQKLHQTDQLPARFVLFGELVYQTSGTCTTLADDYTDRAQVVVTPDAPADLPRPCIVSHFQARLVDAETGSTVWYNRRLREVHVPELTEKWVRTNIRNVVLDTLGGRDGLDRIVAPGSPSK